MRAFHACAFRTDFGKVVANTAAASHGFRRLQQRRINPRFAVRIYFRHRVANRLYKTVDQRGLNIRSCRRIDASAGDEAAFERAVNEVAATARVLIQSLVTNAEPRSREVEAAKARARSVQRFGA